MRKILLESFGDPELMVVSDQPEPELPRDGYVVEIRAAGINFADIVERRGLYAKDQQLPCYLGREASGVVVAKGDEATGFELGEPVIVIRFGGGCYAERVAAGPDQILRGPTGYDFEQLAAFPIVFATAWCAQNEIARVQPGESVLIHAAAGGVGSAAVVLARSLGAAPIIGTAGSDEKCRWVESLGADRCVNYREADFRSAVRELTADRGVDYVLESVGGEVFDQSLQSLAPMGRAVIIGFSSISSDYGDALKRIHPLTLFHRSITCSGLNVQNLNFPTQRDIWTRLVNYVEEHGLKPIVGQTYPLERAADAHTALETRQTRGKLLLIP